MPVRVDFACDTTVMGLMKRGNETAYRKEVQWLAGWCAVNTLNLNTKKKKIIVDFRRNMVDHQHLVPGQIHSCKKVLTPYKKPVCLLMYLEIYLI